MNEELVQNDTQTEQIVQSEQPTPAQQAPTSVEEFEFKWNGKPVKAPREKILNWASQGYDYAQQMNRFKQQQSQWEQETAQLRQVNEYARSNPDWWKHVSSQWENRNSFGQNQEQSGDNHLSQLQQQLQELSQFRDQILSEREQERIKKEDEALKEEVTGIRKQFAQFDWESLDENGYTLEMRVLDHAHKNQIGTFRAAFRDMMHDDLLKNHKLASAESQQKQVQQQVKQGVIAKSPVPFAKESKTPTDIRYRSYDQLAEEAKQELRAARQQQ